MKPIRILQLLRSITALLFVSSTVLVLVKGAQVPDVRPAVDGNSAFALGC